MRRRIYGTRYTTGCGHSWRRRYKRYTVEQMRHATTDCNVCGAMLVFDPAQFEGAREDCFWFNVHLPLFNAWMHAQDPRWPLNGANTGFVEFGPMRIGK